MSNRESMAFDVVVVGAGPAGLAAAIRLKQIAAVEKRDISVCVLEKGSTVGAHILSGAVLETRALDELLPDWRQRGAPVNRPVTAESFLILGRKGAWRVFRPLLPPALRNHGNHIISLGLLCRWLAAEAEALGVEIYPGFAASEILFAEDGRVRGVATGDMGIGRDGQPTPNFTPGMALHAPCTLFAEGCRGHLTRQLEDRFRLRPTPQTHGLGLKELWEIDPAHSRPGEVIHTVGWPLDRQTYGGGFLYHLDDNRLAVGLVVGLDYRNPHLSPFGELQRLKTHPALRPLFAGGRRLAFGARALNEGGWQSMPRLTFPGGALLGCAAGTLNVPKLKGTHTAMKSGMLAAEAVAAGLRHAAPEPAGFESAFHASWAGAELRRARNVRPAFRFGLWAGLGLAGFDQLVLRGRAPWTLRHGPGDAAALQPAARHQPVDYPAPDGEVTFDRLSSVYLTGTAHTENQPCHLTLKDRTVPVAVNLPVFDAPEQRYCPAGVYEIVADGGPRLQINAQNCIHCKTCDIKDPGGNIVWVAPEGGGGPNYEAM